MYELTHIIKECRGAFLEPVCGGRILKEKQTVVEVDLRQDLAVLNRQQVVKDRLLLQKRLVLALLLQDVNIRVIYRY